ncbi:hypothetical protein F4561_001196 [Lipingzhangella halophila]|uniref:Uncharacterized protein n=1 Tax=Lipingzhangella halophila TaxID=1783352 RepID=A0A7W7W181_9ACTN|nr:hypothetical protein [Lipingzhangella halophila]MBB4930376.1 hypothetical protein [Lipingzhangella halophila]
MHDHSAHRVQTQRARVLREAYAANPHRFRSVPLPPPLPEVVHINPPEPQREREEASPDLGEPAA